MEKKFSQYQQAIFDFIIEGKGNAVINAVAGAGKTFTIVNALSLIPSDKKVLFLAFNKHIVNELQGRLQGISNVEVATLHSFGNKVVRNSLKAFMDADKIKKYIDNQIAYWNVPDSALEGFANRVKRLVELAKLSLVNSEPELFKLAFKHGIETYSNEIERALQTLEATDRNSMISFLWMNAKTFPLVSRS
jgi:superfamily I DNA/RNA helicase